MIVTRIEFSRFDRVRHLYVALRVVDLPDWETLKIIP